ncbi:MAG: ParA family protein [Candidatus Omnitrophota bacterium]
MFEDLKKFFSKKDGRDVQSDIINDFCASSENSGSSTKMICVVNQKGGCGKTTTCINLSSGLVTKGFKVLIIDLDAQAHASLGIGINVDNLEHSIYDVMVRNIDLEQIIMPTYISNLDIVPSTSMLTGAQLEIADILGRERILRTAVYKMLNTNAKKYDYIIIDCSPSLNILTINGLAAVHYILVPIQTHYFSLEGMKELFSTLHIVKERLNFQLEVLGILPTLFDGRTKMNREILYQIKDYFKEKVFKTAVRVNVKLAEASLYKKSIFDYDASSNGAKDYLALTEEVIALTQPQARVNEVKNSDNARETSIVAGRGQILSVSEKIS